MSGVYQEERILIKGLCRTSNTIKLYNLVMNFDDFRKVLDKDTSPRRAYELYLQTKLVILEEILIASNLISRAALKSVEEKVLNILAKEIKE